MSTGTIKRSRRVVVVDGEPAFRRKVVRYLDESGHRGAGFSNVEQALADIRRDTPDVVVADINLPRGGGVALFRSVRADANAAHVPFMFVGRRGHPLEVDRGIRLDPVALLRKPFTRRQLAAWLGPLFTRLDRIHALGKSRTFRADLTFLDQHDLLGLIRAFRLTGLLRIRRSPEDTWAEALFLEGDLVHAAWGELRGGDVLMEIMLWSRAEYEFSAESPGRVGRARTVSKKQWREIAASIELVDRGRLNPFPVRATRVPARSSRVVSRADRGGRESESGPGARGGAGSEDLVGTGPGEPHLVLEPPPPRWEEDDDVEILVCDELNGLPDEPNIDLTPLPTTFELAGATGPELTPTRGSVLAYLVRRGQVAEGRSFADLLQEARGRVAGDWQLQTSDGGVVASTVGSGGGRRRRFAMWGGLAHELAAGAGRRAMPGGVQGIGQAFERGVVVVWSVTDELQLFCHAHGPVRLGAVMIECRRLAARLARAVRRGPGGGEQATAVAGTDPRGRDRGGGAVMTPSPRAPLSPPGKQRLSAALQSLHVAVHALEASAVVDRNGEVLAAAGSPDVPADALGTMVVSLAALAETIAGSLPVGAWRTMTVHGVTRFLAVVPVGREAMLACVSGRAVRPGLVLLKLNQSVPEVLRALSM